MALLAKLIDSKLAAGIDVLLDIEVVGSKIVQTQRPNTPLIFVAPPSFEELSRRLHARQTDARKRSSSVGWSGQERNSRKFHVIIMSL